MRFKHIISISVIVVVIGIGVLYFLNMFNINERGIRMDYLKVKFYKVIDPDKAREERNRLLQNPPEKFNRERDIPSEKYVGYAEYKNGKVTIDVTDPELAKRLKTPFLARGGGHKDGVFYEEFVELKPGTGEHLNAVSKELQGYTAITYDKEEPDKK